MLTLKFKELVQNQNIGVIIFKVSTIISFFALIIATITISSILPVTINKFFHITTNVGSWYFYSVKIYLIIIDLLLLFAAFLLLMVAFTSKTEERLKHLVIVTLLATFSINIYALIFNLSQNYQWQKKEKKRNLEIKCWQKFKVALGIRKWLIIDYTMMGTFTGLTIGCVFIEQNLLPHLPYGGGIALKYIPLIVISFTIGFLGGWITGACSALMLILFSSPYIITLWSYILDYFLPMTTPALVALLRFDLKADKSIFTYINYFLHCFLVCLIIYFWQTLSGYFIWSQISSNKIWPGFTTLFYSLVYNFFHIFLFTYPIMQLLIPFIYRGLVSYFLTINNYY